MRTQQLSARIVEVRSTEEIAALDGVSSCNNECLLQPIGFAPPVEFDEEYYRSQETLAVAAGLNETTRREDRGGSVVVAALASDAAVRRE